MKVAVAGLWHLGCVTAACLANANHDVLAYDANTETMHLLQQGRAPIAEPGLNDLIANSINTGKLRFATKLEELSEAEVLWITFDTPVDDNDIADVASVTNEIQTLFPYLQNNTLVLISSQIPVGSTRILQQYCDTHYPTKNITFAYSPENLRLGKAINVFTQPDRVVVGLQTESDKNKIQQLLNPYTQNIIWMSIESAEMTKHAVNAFLATSVVFINELATLCERAGANAREVEQGLKSEERIGPKAYLRPGNAIDGGTLARDVNYLIQLGQKQTLPTPLFSALLDSNHAHKQWSCRKVTEILKTLKDKTIVALGLAYKVGTDTLRRSQAIETCIWLSQQGAKIIAYDPAINSLSTELTQFIELKSTLAEAIQGAEAIIISTECPEFAMLQADTLLTGTKQPLIFDASGYLAKNLGNDNRIRYFTVGKQS
jgi:UDPglucose 6-dehydrogenase